MYSESEIAADVAYTARKKQVLEENLPDKQKALKWAVVFEGIFHRGAHAHGWFGENAHIIKTSAFDDWKHGIDGVVEFLPSDKKESTKHLAVAIDVTFAKTDVLRKKIQRIVGDIQHGNLGTVKYFRTGNVKEKLSKVPRVVVGVDHDHLKRLSRDVFINPQDTQLQKHPFQLFQLKQIRLQLEIFANLARRLNQPDIADIYERDAKIVQGILRQKQLQENIKMEPHWENDSAFLAIKKELEGLK